MQEKNAVLDHNLALQFQIVATRHAKSLGFLQIFRPDSLRSVEDGPEVRHRAH
jgi:hypothetical protein